MLSYVKHNKSASESLGELSSVCVCVCLPHVHRDHGESGKTSNARSERCGASGLTWLTGL